MQVAVCDNF